MKVISTINRKWEYTKGKEYLVLEKQEKPYGTTVIKIKDDFGMIHWVTIGNAFVEKNDQN